MGEFNRPWIRASVTKELAQSGHAASLIDALRSALDELPADMRDGARADCNCAIGLIRSVTVSGMRRATPEEAAELLRGSPV